MNNADQQFSIITAVQSGSAAVRLREARRFLEQFEPGAEVRHYASGISRCR
jgi:hypothetical protein